MTSSAVRLSGHRRQRGTESPGTARPWFPLDARVTATTLGRSLGRGSPRPSWWACQHARAHVSFVMADHGLGAQAHRVGAGEVRRGIGLDVEQVGDAERRPSAGSSESQLREDPSGPPLAGGCGVHGVLDDPHRDRRPVALAGRVQLHEVAAVGEHPGRGQCEGPRRTPRPATGCARRWRVHRGPGSGTGSCGRPAPASQARTPPAGLVPRSASPSVQGPKVAPTSAPVPDSAAGSQRTCRNAPARVAFEGRPKYAAFSVVSGTSLVVPSIDTTRSPQQNTPAAPTGPALESKGTDTRRVAARST
jgi:hypothetical protein